MCIRDRYNLRNGDVRDELAIDSIVTVVVRDCRQGWKPHVEIPYSTEYGTAPREAAVLKDLGR